MRRRGELILKTDFLKNIVTISDSSYNHNKRKNIKYSFKETTTTKENDFYLVANFFFVSPVLSIQPTALAAEKYRRWWTTA